MATAAKLIHGAVKRSQWCELHHLPHVFEYTLYSVWEAAGQFNMAEVKKIRKCDMR